MYRIYILLTTFIISIAAFGTMLGGSPDKSERAAKHTPIQTHQYSDIPRKQQAPLPKKSRENFSHKPPPEGWMYCKDCSKYYALPPRPTDFPPLLILNAPNGLAECLEKYHEENTDVLLQYLEDIRQAELQCLKKKRSDRYIELQHSPYYPLYFQLSVLYYQPLSLNSSLCNALKLSSTPTIDRPLLRAFIAMCKEHPNTHIKTMLATVERTPQTDESIKNFIAYKNNDSRQQIAALYDGLDHKTSAAHEVKARNSKESHYSKISKILSSAFNLLLPFPFFSLGSCSNDTETGSEDGAYYDTEDGDYYYDSARTFDCGNGETVGRGDICDWVSDCSNGKDETADVCCDKSSISGKFCNDKYDHHERWYLCDDGSGYVIPESSLCDGTGDCPNHVDDTMDTCCAESHQTINTTCTSKVTGQRLHVCPNKHTILQSDLCDGVNNCGDYSDETIGQCCASGPLPSGDECHSEDGSKRYFRCNNGRGIEVIHACNGRNDCGDASDELSAKCCIAHYPGRFCAISPYKGLYKCGSSDNPSSRDYICSNSDASHTIDPRQYPTPPHNYSFANVIDDTETSDSFNSSSSSSIALVVGGTLVVVAAVSCAVKYYLYPSCKKKTSYQESPQEATGASPNKERSTTQPYAKENIQLIPENLNILETARPSTSAL